MIKYGILDEEGNIVRWTNTRPDKKIYKYVVVKTKPKPGKFPIDWSNFEPSIF